jgi:hypothetical protein
MLARHRGAVDVPDRLGTRTPPRDVDSIWQLCDNI